MYEWPPLRALAVMPLSEAHFTLLTTSLTLATIAMSAGFVPLYRVFKLPVLLRSWIAVSGALGSERGDVGAKRTKSYPASVGLKTLHGG